MENLENKQDIIKVGLKNNALFLLSAMQGDTLCGCTDGIFHNAIVLLTKTQFEKFKSLIVSFGYDEKKSLAIISLEKDIDFSCSLVSL
jgi:hypothetical protein